ncbi:hypothetical protein [Methanosphaerula palustris]|uniref:Uncharacterized protein n=1 Tax=Methanosphaerula palustris (strain ATCC BAA-1556 / DSM 19958 / E1-9c) TaxID=521011 RepID=B8GGU5_METPE|nr:hypothetical protein [Methanosphaerula palustris]ACL16350.1 hypothetical protein Mpal_1000 [Methanosphaerula palustris E1-9c]
MPDKDSPPRIHRRVNDNQRRREKVAEGAESGTRKHATTDEPGGRLNRVYTDVRTLAHHTNAELKMMRERNFSVDDQHRKF